MKDDSLLSHRPSYRFRGGPLIMLAACGVVCLLLANAALSTQIYQWVDADGNVQFSQEPPPAGIEANTVEPKYSKGSDQAQEDLQKRIDGLDQRRDARQQRAAEQQEEAEEAAAKQRRCDSALRRLASYSRPRVNEAGEDGQRVRIGEEQRQAELAKTRDYLAEHCQ